MIFHRCKPISARGLSALEFQSRHSLLRCSIFLRFFTCEVFGTILLLYLHVFSMKYELSNLRDDKRDNQADYRDNRPPLFDEINKALH